MDTVGYGRRSCSSSWLSPSWHGSSSKRKSERIVVIAASIRLGLWRAGNRGRAGQIGRTSILRLVVERMRCVDPYRSEEHTSELQSRQYLVCRLLLEKTQK